MANDSYLNLEGETQGNIPGSCTQAGREDKIQVYAVSHEILSPRDAASGLPTGKRQHKPVTITKAIDKSSPGLFSALTNNENIPKWRLDFWRPSRSGKEEQYYTMELINASVSSIRSDKPNNKYPENMKIEFREHVSFCYQKIIVTWNDGGITAEDDWETPNA